MTGAPVLICGAGGQVGRALVDLYARDGRDVVACDRQRLDLRDTAGIWQVLREVQPAVVVNAAAYTAVDLAESEPDIARAVNCDGAAALAAGCERIGAALISYSTDYVFDGRKTEPYVETDPIAPVSVYGRTKAFGEGRIRDALERHLILRTSWVFSAGRPNFVNTILRLGAERDSLRIVADEIGCPTFAGDIAAVTVRLIDLMEAKADFPWGTYHYCGAGPLSRFEFAETILREAAGLTGRSVELAPIASSEFPTAAARPLRAVLDCGAMARTFDIAQPDWRLPLPQVIKDFHGNRTGQA